MTASTVRALINQTVGCSKVLSPVSVTVPLGTVIVCNGKFIRQDKGLMRDCEHPMFSLKLLSYYASPETGWSMSSCNEIRLGDTVAGLVKLKSHEGVGCDMTPEGGNDHREDRQTTDAGVLGIPVIEMLMKHSVHVQQKCLFSKLIEYICIEEIDGDDVKQDDEFIEENKGTYFPLPVPKHFQDNLQVYIHRVISDSTIFIV
ncbi:hypothetical protein MJG53_018837 [Ovis ammon polii x Ovis aries]|uniref:Uncharacterized protein n=1 Tax=Ovis ammon polii x Ovis aries TaxID=2918886 RepID=A0ACB9U346_9CETA|nr:hypothetical protein MJG53_018837 [Ovis ammon polii x Ovis aries]